MEFLPIEKYSSDRRTTKHKKDVTKLEKKAIVKKVKAGRKAKTARTTTPPEKESDVSDTEECVSDDEENDSESTTRQTRVKKIPNRLFVNMKKKILDIQEVKDLHPDIVSITLPRKKCSSWCWAVFESKEKAVKALRVLKKREDIIVNEMLSEDVSLEKKKKKLEKVRKKKAIKDALKDAYM